MYNSWRLDDTEFNTLVKPIVEMTAEELCAHFDTLDGVVQGKILHTVLHNTFLQKKGESVLGFLPETYRYHDMDKVLMYMATNTLDKSKHKQMATHHRVNVSASCRVLESNKYSPENKELVRLALLEKLCDWECTGMSKPKQPKNAYEVAEEQNVSLYGMQFVFECEYKQHFPKERGYVVSQTEYELELESMSFRRDVLPILSRAIVWYVEAMTIELVKGNI